MEFYPSFRGASRIRHYGCPLGGGILGRLHRRTLLFRSFRGTLEDKKCALSHAHGQPPWGLPTAATLVGPASLPALPLLGLSCAPLFPFFVTLTPHVVGKTAAPRLIGFQVASANLGAAALPVLVGTLVDVISLEAIAYVIAGLSLLLAVFYRLWIGPRG